MKTLIKTLFIISFTITSCDNYLDIKPLSELAPDNFLKTEEGLQSLLYSSYANWFNTTGNNRGLIGVQEFGADIIWQSGGGENRDAVQFLEFTHGPETGIVTQIWTTNYRAIRDANLLIENIDETDIHDDKKKLYKAEARFIRAISYYRLFLAYGTVPLRTSTTQELEIPRALENEMKQFIEQELLDVVDLLPFPGDETIKGRANKGAALGYLVKFYLNTKQWDKCSQTSKILIDLNHYDLFPIYENLFNVEYEDNNEIIWTIELIASTEITSNAMINAVFPVNFAKDPKTGLEWNPNWRRIASQYRIIDEFYNSFEDGDKRKNLILTEYINFSGELVSLLNNDDTRPFKYWPDPNGFGASHGNDLPQIRYADILLSRAEALNEINGPTQESVSLINLIRNRAGLKNKELADFPSKDSLRAHILDERGWEFWFEAKRRYDLIRMDKFIEKAHARGKSNAQPHHVKFPIPQFAMDSNPLLEQNSGY